MAAKVDEMGRGPRSATLRRWLVAGAGVSLVVAAVACSYDFEAFDPRITAAGPGTGGSGTGGGDTGGSTPCTPGQVVPCYTGPEGTEGVGICHGGSAECNPSGAGFGACQGEITPLAEDCNTLGDDDCDGAANEPDAQCQCEPGQVGACYEGPSSTMDHGACHAGEQICQAAGTSYGPCYGQMLPRHESCETEIDDDCDDVANDHCALWSRRYGGSSTDVGWAVAVDGSGNVVVVGELRNTVNLGGVDLTGDSSGDAFVAKYDGSGNPVWSKRFGGAGTFDVAYDVAIDEVGDIYVTGAYSGAMDFGGGNAFVSLGADDVFVLKLDAAGNTLWARGYGDLLAQRGYAVAYGAGHVVVTGGFTGSFSIETTALSATAEGTSDGFAAALDSTSGALEWAIRFGGAGTDEGIDVAVDGTGATYLVGYFASTVSFGGATIDHQSAVDGFVAKLDAAGAELWSMGVGAAGDQFVEAVGLAPSDGIVVAGEYDGTLTLATDQWASLGEDDTWVARITAAGTVSWGASFGGEYDEDVDAVRVAADGSIYVAGATNGAVDYGDGPLVVAGVDDWVLLALDSSGAIRYTRRFGSADDQDLRGLALDGADRPVVAGGCSGAMNLGSGPLLERGGMDICLGKLEP